jgi:hypothetical protein
MSLGVVEIGSRIISPFERAYELFCERPTRENGQDVLAEAFKLWATKQTEHIGAHISALERVLAMHKFGWYFQAILSAARWLARKRRGEYQYELEYWLTFWEFKRVAAIRCACCETDRDVAANHIREIAETIDAQNRVALGDLYIPCSEWMCKQDSRLIEVFQCH